jgi:hypothetical protein
MMEGVQEGLLARSVPHVSRMAREIRRRVGGKAVFVILVLLPERMMTMTRVSIAMQMQM